MSGEKTLRVLMIGPHKALNGGVASVTSDLLEAFKDDPSISLQELATIRTREKLIYPANFVVFLARIFGLSIFSKFDVAHIHLASKGSAYRKFIAMAVLCLFGKKYLVHLHGAKFDDFHSSLPRPLAFVVRYYLQRAVYVVALSNSWERWLQNCLHLENTRVINNGSPSAKRDVEPSIPSTKFVCFFGGRLEDRKGPGELLKACSIPPLKNNVQIWFAGDGDNDHYRTLAQKLNVIDDCTFFGWMNKEDYFKKLNQADVFILPSFAEGMPMSIIESMSAGIPPISTTVGGIPELVNSGKTGILIEPGDTEALHNAIKSLLENPDVRIRMSDACLDEYKRNFSVDRMYSDFKILYQEIASK